MVTKKKLLPAALLFSVLILIACPADDENNGITQGNGEETGEKLWLIGAVNNWSLNNPYAFTAQGNSVYRWQGNLPSGQFHFNGDTKPAYTGVWYGPATNGEKAAGNGLAVPMYRNSYNWTIDTPGNYIISADIPAMQVRFEYNPDNPDPGNPKGKYGNYYEIFVGSFYDSQGGNRVRAGNLKGIIEKLDYLNDGNPNSNTSLHVDGIWLMPINPSPSYHKYDVRDYKAIDSAYGTMGDFEDLIAACKARGIRVIIDLVVNHTSTQHTWFRQAQGGSAVYEAYYNIITAAAKPPGKYYRLYDLGGNPTAVAKWYEAQFDYGMPDLNYDNPAVWNEMKSIVDFWLGKGVAGFRLDAVKHVYNTQAQNIEWLRTFVDYCNSKKSDVYIVAEVWDSESTIQNYYGSGIPSNFNFPAAQNYIPTYVRYTPAKNFAQYAVNWNSQIKTKNSAAIDAPFFANHDMPRFASIVGTNNTTLKMAASMLIFMPGNPFIYYGEELGMTGYNWNDGTDENVRGPMVWSRTNRAGQTRGPAGNNQPYWDASSVDEQLADQNSILRYYIDALKLKNRYPQIHRGMPATLTAASNDYVSAYRISGGAGEKDLAVVHNLSANSQTVTVSGVSVLGGTLGAAGAAAAKPSLSGASLTMPAYTTAVLEY